MSLIHPDDPPVVRKQIKELRDLGYFVERKTRYQIKVGAFNYYWTKGTIYRDPCHRLAEKGFAAFLKALASESPG